VIRVDRAGETMLELSAGRAHRADQVAMTVDTRLAMASGSKAFTALVVHALVADGALALTTRARELLGDDLPLIDDRVTVEHLLAHRSGIGDYLDEGAGYRIDDYVLTVPVHTLSNTVDYLSVLDGRPNPLVLTNASPTTTADSSYWPSSPNERPVPPSSTWCSNTCVYRPT